jgi:NitT/TauT family transport system permease protein
MRFSLFRVATWVGPPVGLFLAVLLCWQLGTTLFKVPAYLFPSPGQVYQAAVEHRQELTQAVFITGSAASLGFIGSLLAGFVVSLAFSQSPLIRRSCYPYAIFLQTVPIVAIAPLIINWFGFGFRSVVIVSFIIGLFPIITNATTGMLAVDQRFLELFQIYNASRWQILWKLRVPNCVPFLVAGAKTSSGLSVIGAIVGEFFVGFGSDSHGLGYYITLASGQLKTDVLFAAVLTCTLLGLTVFVLVNVVSLVVLRRWNSAG